MRQFAMTSNDDRRRSPSRTIAAPPSGIPLRMTSLGTSLDVADEDRARLPSRRELRDTGERGAEQSFDEEHERQRPHRGATCEHAMATNTAT